MNKLELFNKDCIDAAPKLRRAALKECGDMYADDLVQKTLMIMWEKYDSYTQGTCFFNWSYTIMLNILRNFNRALKAYPVVQSQRIFEITAEKAMQETPVEINRDLADRLERGMARLKPEEKDMLDAVYVQGQSIKEWALANGKAPQTAFNRMNMIKNKIRNT